MSPSNRAGDLQQRVSDLLEAGTRLVWVIDPGRETIAVHDQCGMPRMLRAPALLGCDVIMPGLSLDIGALFREY